MASVAVQSVPSRKGFSFDLVYMHVWPLAVPKDQPRGGSALELELIGSHTSDPYHLDPSCPACTRLRGEMQAIAESVVEPLASGTHSASFEIFTDPACIVCSSDGQRPCVTVSIYVRGMADGSQRDSDGVSTAVNAIKEGLKSIGIRER